MDRKRLLSVLALLTVFLNSQSNPRNISVLAEGWKFIQKEVADGAYPGLNTDDWETVSVPHDWAINKPFDMKIDRQVVQVIADGEKQPLLRTGRTGALPAFGVRWYRKFFSVPASDEGRIISVEFDGAMSNARVFLNGQFVGEWPYGYSSFSFDITRFIRFGEENLLAVRLNNKEKSSRWYTGAGLYRDVRLVTTGPVHVAHWGTYVTTPVVSDSSGVVTIKTTVNNQSGKSEKVELVTEILDSSGLLVARTSSQGKITDSLEFDQELRVSYPAKWTPETPNLYKAVSKVYIRKKLQDAYETSFGFRTIRFEKDSGFFLNGEQVKIKGVCLHHTLGPLGAEFSRRAAERQFEMLKEMGCNAIRSAHNPPAPSFLDLCDEMGFLVMDESFDEWKMGKTGNGYHSLFDQWAEKDLTAMIRRDRNHPSIILWSIGNEVMELGSKDKKGKNIAGFLTAVCHREDPTRPVLSAFNYAGRAVENGMADEVDIVGINYPATGGMSYTKYRRAYPGYTFIGSETNCTASSRGVYKFPPKTGRSPWYEDYQLSSYDMEGPLWFSTPDTDFAMLEECPAVAGEFVWTGFDYLGEPTPYNEGTTAKSSYIGIIDLAGLKKDRFYLYQSQWSEKPMLHVLPHWTWPEKLNDTIPVMCYTNYPKAELFVNGKSIGVREKDKRTPFTRYRLIWDEVIYQPGEIKVVALDENNNPVASQLIKTAGKPNQIRLTPDRKEIKADGKDLCFITVEVLDEEGNLCPTANILQYFTVKGAGELKAVCNGDPTDQTSFASNYMKTFNGKLVVVVKSTKKAGKIYVNSEGSRLKKGSVALEATL